MNRTAIYRSTCDIFFDQSISNLLWSRKQRMISRRKKVNKYIMLKFVGNGKDECQCILFSSVVKYILWIQILLEKRYEYLKLPSSLAIEFCPSMIFILLFSHLLYLFLSRFLNLKRLILIFFIVIWWNIAYWVLVICMKSWWLILKRIIKPL